MRFLQVPLSVLAVLALVVRVVEAENKTAKSLFAIVRFPNGECQGSTATNLNGTCFTSLECSSFNGTADGACAMGFGVCCLIATSTCGATISTNTTYIRNPGYPSPHTATSASSCSFTIRKCDPEVCQLRLDFQTFSGLATDTDAAKLGDCQDTFSAEGQTGKNPPDICGTNTGYHMYVEFGANSADTVKLTVSYIAAALTSAKSFNILARQISCFAEWRAPTDCVQWHTGTSGNVLSYNHAGGQLLQKQIYNNCIRTEKGYCKIQWKESSTENPDPFKVGPPTDAIGGNGNKLCTNAFITIPNLSPNGDSEIPPGAVTVAAATDPKLAFQSQMCGIGFGIGTMMGDQAQALTTRQQPFIVGVYTDDDATALTGSTGFNLAYTQLPC